MLRHAALTFLLAGSLGAQDFFFTSNRGNTLPGDFDIYRYTNGVITPSVLGRGTIEDSPRLSADGKTLFYVSRQVMGRLAGHEGTWLMRQNLATGAVKPVVPGLREPALHPDGKRVYGVKAERIPQSDDLRQYLWVVDGERPVGRRAARSGAVIGQPSVGKSKTGKVMVAYSSTDDGDSEIYLTDETLQLWVRQLTKNTYYDAHPVISPDGTTVLFETNERYPNNPEKTDLFTMGIDGRDRQPVVISTGGRLTPFEWVGKDSFLYTSSNHATLPKSDNPGIYRFDGRRPEPVVISGTSAGLYFWDTSSYSPTSEWGEGSLYLGSRGGAGRLDRVFELTVPRGFVSREFRWDDGAGNTWTTREPKTTHTFAGDGEFHVHVTAVDGGNNWFQGDTLVRTWRDPDPYEKGVGAEIHPPVDFTAVTGNSNLSGLAYDGSSYWVTGRATTAGGFHQLYRISEDFKLVARFDQPHRMTFQTPNGMRDLCFDGNRYLYGVDERCWVRPFDTWKLVWSHEAAVACKPFVAWPTGIALTAQDSFVIANATTRLWEFDRSGKLLWTGHQRDKVTSLAFDSYGKGFFEMISVGSVTRPQAEIIAVRNMHTQVEIYRILGEASGGSPGGVDFALVHGQPTVFALQRGARDIMVPFVADLQFGRCPGAGFRLTNGPAVSGNTKLGLELHGVPPGNFVVPWLSTSNTKGGLPLPLLDCSLLVFPDFLLPPLTIGQSSRGLVPTPIPPGWKGDLLLQGLVVDPRNVFHPKLTPGAKMRVK